MAIRYAAYSNTPVADAMGFGGGQLTGPLARAVSVLTDAASIVVDTSLGDAFTGTLLGTTGTRVLANPIGTPANEQRITFRFAQDGTGGAALTYGTEYAFAAGVAPVLSTGVNKVDRLEFVYSSAATKWELANFSKGIA